MMTTIIVDIDGTLADCRHRLRHVLPGGKRDWDAFFAGMADDDIIRPVADITAALHYHYKIVLCSGRPENYRAETEAWLRDAFIPYDALYMRPAGDTRPDHIVKAQILRGIREDGYDPFLVIDDRQGVVEMWRDAGLVCLQAAPAEPSKPSTALLTLMVGPSGAGKSTYCSRFAGNVVSSDQIRSDLCGDHRDQSRNVEVFSALHALARVRLKHDLPTIIDATHIRRKDRMSSAALANGGPVEYVVVDRPMRHKQLTAGWRLDVKVRGVPLIEAHDRTFMAQISEILAGDGLENVMVRDMRHAEAEITRKAA